LGIYAEVLASILDTSKDSLQEWHKAQM
jgi:hypothetical protein